MVNELYSIFYQPLMIISILASVSVIVLIWQRRQYPGAWAMIALAAATSVWTAGFLIETNMETLEQQLLLTNIAYFGSMTVPVAWFTFSLQYTVGEKAITNWQIMLLCIIPVVTMALIWSNDWHHLMWYNEHLAVSGPFMLTVKTYGRFFWVALANNYILIITGSIILLRRLFTGTPLHRDQALALIVAVSLPLIWNMIYVFDLVPLPRKDLTPVMFAISGIAITFGLIRFQMFRTIPYAREFVLRQMNDGILIFDTDDRLLEANRATLEILGTDRKVIGKKMEELLPLSPLFERLSLKNFGLFELPLPVSDQTRFLELETMEMRDNNSRLLGWLAILHDITARKKMQEQVMIQDRLASIGQLTSGVAHELNNPLTTVIGFSELLLKRDLPEDIKGDLETIGREAKRTAEIVRNLLTFARMHPQEKKATDINENILNVLKLRTYEHNVSNIQAITRLDPDLPKITGNGFQLQQVFLNIIINAEFFMLDAHKKGTLTITTERIRDFARISFADDGPGIPEKDIPSLFTPFFTTKDVGKGTGLGLSICYGIVTEHGGRIWAESEPGQGAVFNIELPLPGPKED